MEIPAIASLGPEAKMTVEVIATAPSGDKMSVMRSMTFQEALDLMLYTQKVGSDTPSAYSEPQVFKHFPYSTEMGELLRKGTKHDSES